MQVSSFNASISLNPGAQNTCAPTLSEVVDNNGRQWTALFLERRSSFEVQREKDSESAPARPAFVRTVHLHN